MFTIVSPIIAQIMEIGYGIFPMEKSRVLTPIFSPDSQKSPRFHKLASLELGQLYYKIGRLEFVLALLSPIGP